MLFPEAALYNLRQRLGLASTAGIPLRPLLKRFALIYLIGVAILTSAIVASISLNTQSRLDKRE